MPAVALTIAGSDPSGGAGIQADLKTFHQFGVYGEAVVTLITAQNTQSLSYVQPLSADLVKKQIAAVLADIPPAAAKIGALGSSSVVEAVAELAPSFSFPLVIDPVMIGKHGASLLKDAVEPLKQVLLPHASLVTPNIPEAEALTGITISNEDEMLAAACRLLDLGCRAVLLKGGHLAGPVAVDILVGCGQPAFLRGKRVQTPHTHGTGCTYSAAITAGLANGHTLPDAVRGAKAFVQRAIETAPGLGSGNGPLNHFAAV
jgi:hydroxymethylpyrimidine/phosphomethylpyrimidine kinase